jgi:hypothetical protein
MFTNPEEEKKFKDFIESCIESRLHELSQEYSESKEYLIFREQLEIVGNNLKDVLPKESNHLVNKYDDLYTDLLIDHQKYYFIQGITICFMLMKELLYKSI